MLAGGAAAGAATAPQQLAAGAQQVWTGAQQDAAVLPWQPPPRWKRPPPWQLAPPPWQLLWWPRMQPLRVPWQLEPPLHPCETGALQQAAWAPQQLFRWPPNAVVSGPEAIAIIRTMLYISIDLQTGL